MLNGIKRPQFILMVVNHFEENTNGRDQWTVEDSFVSIAERIDLADMNEKDYDRLLKDCKYNTNNYLDLEG